MAIEAPLSKYKKQNLLIMVVVLVGLAGWFIYDGYISEKFQQEHTETNEAGEEVPDSSLAFNRKAPPFFLGAGLLVVVYFFVIKGKKVVAGEKSLVLNGKEIQYDSIEKINKTFFDKKGYFILTYKEGGTEVDVKLSDRSYDNMPAVLDELVKQIS
jgi:hypothetical protein